MLRLKQTAFTAAVIACALTPQPSDAGQPQPLGTFVRQTLALHPAVKAAEKAVEAAKARNIAAGQYPHNPELEVGYEDAAERSKDIGLSQTFDVWGRTSANVGVATAAIRAAEASQSLVRAEVLKRLLAALGELAMQRHRRDLAEKRLKLSQTFLSLIERSAAAGDVGQSALLSARTNLSNARLRVAALSADMAGAEAALIALTGEARDDWPAPPDILLVGSVPPSPPNVTKVPELRLAKAEYNVGRAAVNVADKERLPDPTVGLRVGKDGDANLFGLSLSMPLPVWNQGLGERLSAAREAAAREFRVADTERRIRARLTGAEKRLKVSLIAVRRWRSQVAPVLRQQEELLATLSRVREINALDYVQQLNQLFETKTLGIELEAALWTAWVSRLRAGAQLETWLETL